LKEHTLADDRWIPEDDYQFICARVPIVCVDLLPIFRGHYGLIKRNTYSGMTGLSLVGGGVLLDEPLVDALQRHVYATLGPDAALMLATLRQVGVYQYFRQKREGQLHDPRKNAVSITYVGQVEGTLAPSGEALDLRLFSFGERPDLDAFGFGQGIVAYDCIEAAKKPMRAPDWEI
jgi:ADP-ribose pyrophosphatase YjhB (NUDIX family)